MRNTIVSTCVLAWLAAQPAHPATYYVDAATGNDAWAGTQSTAGASNGPWSSLGRVNAAALAPGDQVRLKCGSTWYETLAPNGSGTSASPIYIGAFPADCTSPPTVMGSDPIPWTAWEVYSGGIYRAALPSNLLTKAAFGSGATDWRPWSEDGRTVVAPESNCASPGNSCIAVTTGPAWSLVSSAQFALRNSAYSVSFSIRAPSGTSTRVVVRRNEAPYDVVGVVRVVTGTGAWQNVTAGFAPAKFISNVRLDFELPPSATVSLDQVRVQAAMSPVRDVHVTGHTMLRARHPNRTTTQYLPMAADADSVLYGGKSASTYAVFGSLGLPPGAALLPGMTIRMRTNSFVIDERIVTSVAGNRLYLNTPSWEPLKSGWGYYLTGALWMLDQPGEWHFDAASNSLYVWMPDGSHPGSRVSVGHRDVGIDLSNKHHIVVESIAVREAVTGIRMSNSRAVTLRNALVTDSAIDGIDASGSAYGIIENSTIARTGRDAVSGIDHVTGATAVGMRVSNNQISESGVIVNNGQVAGLPIRSFAAIRPGSQATVTGNRIVNAGYNGIYPSPGSTISSNYIEGTCLVLDDCGAIYMYGAHSGTQVERNLIARIPGATDGKPQGYHTPTDGRGIYLDEETSGVTVFQNTVVNADYGIALHNASANRVQGNTLYGNRLYQVGLQSSPTLVNPSGTLSGNDILSNTMVPDGVRPSVLQQSRTGEVTSFARFNDNRYSALKASQMAREIRSTGEKLYTFPDWQSAKDGSGLPRYLDVNGSQVTLAGSASFRVVGANQIPNINLANGTYGWAVFSQLAPWGTAAPGACAVGPCVNYTSGGGYNILSSPNFSVVAGNWYRVSFDLTAALDGMGFEVGVRRGGGGSNGYEWLMNTPPTFYGSSSSWKRFSFVFQALKTVNAADPVTRDLGARLDFTLQASGVPAWIANVEIVPIAPVGAGILRTDVLLNPSMQTALLDCPATASDAVFCLKYVKFSDGSPVSWPYPIGPLGSEIIYSRGDTLSDADGDGIADIQDRCPGSPSGTHVNALGCGLGQSPSW